MTGERSERLRQGYAAWNRGDVDDLLALCHPDVTIRPLIGAVVAEPEYEGHDGVRRLFADAREPWGEFRVEPEEFVEAGDHLIVHAYVTLTGKDGSLTLDGHSSHVVGFRDGLVVWFAAFRDPEQALASLAG